ncbi:MAG: flagellar protein FlaG [Candidatus Competibacteraceae bacterium]|nr:flagellar protein FlaG [Candidatus Competibacteraceae bacterium]
MTPNITAMSSASPPPINADRRPKASPAENAAPTSPSADGGIPNAPAVPAASATPQSATAASTPQSLAAAVDTINTSLKGLQQTNLQFNMDEESGEMVVKVMDVEKDEVIRQIPPKEILALAAAFKEAAAKQSQGVEGTALGAHGATPNSSVPGGLLLRTQT